MMTENEREWMLSQRLEKAGTRHCSTCRTETTGAPLCDRCAWRMRRDCKVTHLAIIARAGVGSGTIDNLRRDEALLERQAKWEANNAQPE